jgi:hypothetical protein
MRWVYVKALLPLHRVPDSDGAIVIFFLRLAPRTADSNTRQTSRSGVSGTIEGEPVITQLHTKRRSVKASRRARELRIETLR